VHWVLNVSSAYGSKADDNVNVNDDSDDDDHGDNDARPNLSTLTAHRMQLGQTLQVAADQNRFSRATHLGSAPPETPGLSCRMPDAAGDALDAVRGFTLLAGHGPRPPRTVRAPSQEIRKIIAVTKELQRILNDIKLVNPVDVLSQELKAGARGSRV
jgi:hypothetical protein